MKVESHDEEVNGARCSTGPPLKFNGTRDNLQGTASAMLVIEDNTRGAGARRPQEALG